jgi:shikimate kinase
MKPVAVLVGAPGSGKSTIGPLLAQALGVAFRDVDADIVAAEGKPISDIFVDDGEDHFRAVEREAVAVAVASHDGVVSLGGGAILAPSTRELLRSQTVVYLSVDLPEAISRVGLGSGRPLLSVNPRATLRFLLDQRRPLYEEVATITVKTDGRTPEEITEELARELS